MAFFEFQVSSVLPASPDQVWARVSTMEGVNAELRPLARMTYPRDFGRLDPALVPLGKRLFRSWILLSFATGIAGCVTPSRGRRRDYGRT
jgi:hypothetical protein